MRHSALETYAGNWWVWVLHSAIWQQHAGHVVAVVVASCMARQLCGYGPRGVISAAGAWHFQAALGLCSSCHVFDSRLRALHGL